MKKILISFIRNEHLVNLREGSWQDLDITAVADTHSIDRIFLLTNQDRSESITFKNWIAEKLKLEVKAVTLEKGSEKYILNKIESIIKYILLAEEGHASFFYLPGENTLQINLWEIVDKTIYRGKIIYPGKNDSITGPEDETKRSASPSPAPAVKKRSHASERPAGKIPAVKSAGSSPAAEREKTPAAEAPAKREVLSPEEKIGRVVRQGSNILIRGEEGTGKATLLKKILDSQSAEAHYTNFRSWNPQRFDESLDELLDTISSDRDRVFVFMNIEVIPFHIQERLSELMDVQLLSTFNISESAETDSLNRKFYYLLSKNLLTLPPLRARKEELDELIEGICRESQWDVPFTEEALAYLKRHNWPGNFNELTSLVSRVCGENPQAVTEDLVISSMDSSSGELNQWRTVPMGDNFNLKEVIGEVAMHYIMMALEICEGKKSKAAKMLGFSNYQTLSNWMKKYGG